MLPQAFASISLLFRIHNWTDTNSADILRLRFFWIEPHNIDHAWRYAIPIRRWWLSQLVMTATSPARSGANPHTRWLHQLPPGISMTADLDARPDVNPHTRWLHQLLPGMSMTADHLARPSANPHARWLHQLPPGISMTADLDARPDVNPHIRWLYQLPPA